VSLDPTQLVFMFVAALIIFGVYGRRGPRWRVVHASERTGHSSPSGRGAGWGRAFANL